jgi:FkbM family methyltransferase
MKKSLSKTAQLLSKIVGKRNLERVLIFAAKSINVKLHEHALLQIGAGTNVFLENGSELFFIEHILKPYFEKVQDAVIFDVGANIGNYSLMLLNHIPGAGVYSFEPVKETFTQLENNVGNKAKVFNIGFGDSKGHSTLYNSANTKVSEITTTHKEILIDVFKVEDELIAIDFEVDKIDNFCIANNIKRLNFLKIDVEGNELQVLKGAANMLANNSIEFIQFEFNSHNIYSRVFLRDFYLLLMDFKFYRLLSNGMVHLGDYNPINEIFTAQNIVAIHNTVSPEIYKQYLS